MSRTMVPSTATSAVWQDFDAFTKQFIPKQTIPTLRSFADRIYANAGINLNLRSQERKADLVAKVVTAFLTMRNKDQQQTYLTTRRACESIAAPLGRGYERSYTPPQPTFGGAPGAPSRPTFGGAPSVPSRMSNTGQGAAAAGPSRAGWSSHSQQTAYTRAAPQLQDWKSSPMWKPVKALTNMEMLPDISANDDNRTRREKKVHFSLTPEILEQLNKTRDAMRTNPGASPQYSVRIFCTSSDHYRPTNLPANVYNEHVSNRRIPIEYPTNPDAAIDSHSVPFKDKGLRGRPGSAPPLDVDKGTHGITRIAGRMASVTMGHTGPTAGKKKDISKKFWFQLVFCEITPIEALTARLNGLTPTDAEKARSKMREKAEDDDDIEVGSAALSLKDPLAGMRILKPVRSSKCRHMQCFDVRWWIHANASHPQWLCPHCSQELDIDDMICDGYVLSILTACPEDVDEVVIEPNGEWHTENNQYASAAWAAEHPPSVPAIKVTAKRERSPSGSPLNGKRPAIELLSDDSDDDAPSGPSTLPVSNATSAHSSSAPPQPSVSRTSSTGPAAAAVIDLTLDSDDEDADDDGFSRAPPPPASASGSSAGFRQPGAVGPGQGAASGTPIQSQTPDLAPASSYAAPSILARISAPSYAAQHYPSTGTSPLLSSSPLAYTNGGGTSSSGAAGGGYGNAAGSAYRGANGFGAYANGHGSGAASGSGSAGYLSPNDALRVDAQLYSPTGSASPGGYAYAGGPSHANHGSHAPHADHAPHAGHAAHGAQASLAARISSPATAFAPSPLGKSPAATPVAPSFGLSAPAHRGTGGAPPAADPAPDPSLAPRPYVDYWDDDDLGAYDSDGDRPGGAY